MDVRSIIKLLDPLKKRVLLMLGRGIIKAIDDSGGIQKLQVSLLQNESTDGIERMQEYGYSSWPLPEGEVLVGFLAGNRDHGIIVATEDRRHRIKNTNEGDVAIYTYENTDHATGHRIILKKNREIEIHCDTQNMVADTDETQDIGNNSTKEVGVDETKTVGNDVTETIGGNETKAITGNKIETITGNKAETITLNKTATVTQNITLTAGGNIAITGTNINIHATGTTQMTLDGDATIDQKGQLDLVSTGGDTNITNATGKTKITCATAEIISPSIDLGATGGPAAARVGDVTTSNGTHPHTHNIAAGSTITNIAT